MSNPAIVAIGLAVVGVVLGAIGVRRRHGSNRLADVPQPATPRVRVLTTDEELRAAVRRAASFERAVADRMQTRASRYEAMVARERVTDIGVTDISAAYPPAGDATEGTTPRSA